MEPKTIRRSARELMVSLQSDKKVGLDPSLRDMQTLARLIYELSDNAIYRTKEEKIMRKMKEKL